MNEEGVATRVFKLKDGEGNARWWGGGLATIKATGKETGGLYSIVEVLEPQGPKRRSTCTAKRTRPSGSSKER